MNHFIKPLLSVCCLLFFVTVSIQAQYPIHNMKYILTSKVGNNQCLSSNNPHTSRSDVVLRSRDRNTYQSHIQWRAEYAGKGWYYLTNLDGNMALDVKNGRRNAGTELWLYPKNNSDAQKFKFEKVGTNYTIIPKLNPNLRLEARHGVNQPGTKIRTVPKNNSNAQKWSFIHPEVKSNYKVFVESITCVKESDPGNEIEVYGSIQIKVKLNKKVKSTKTLLSIPRAKAVDIPEGGTHRLGHSINFRENNAMVEYRICEIELVARLVEDDGSSFEDSLYGTDTWVVGHGLNRNKTTIIKRGGNEIHINWRVIQEEAIQ